MTWWGQDREPSIVHVVQDTTDGDVRPVGESRDEASSWEQMENYAHENNGRTVNTESYIDYPVEWLKNNAKR